ncbi:MAG TPA: hypothetical protein VFI65_09985 [Streptosporangiaceae bacterium]|jgi:hypothetical protein|nr:hypothetical protein [Streptosporangiaceae bacterium]
MGRVSRPDSYRGQVDGGLVHVVALVVSGGDGAELPELAEAALDGVALVVSGVEDRRAPAGPSAGRWCFFWSSLPDDRLDPALVQVGRLAVPCRAGWHKQRAPSSDNEENVMNYHGLVKRLDLPAGWMAPTKLEYDDIRARAISRADNDDDVQGINASIELIRRTRGGSWPTGPVSADFNYVDEVWHECEFREGDSFTYAVYDSRGQYLGCCYLYPMGRRTPLTGELLTYDVDVSWWVTPDAYERGYYAKLYAALRHWTGTAFPFTKAYYSNTEIPELPG